MLIITIIIIIVKRRNILNVVHNHRDSNALKFGAEYF